MPGASQSLRPGAAAVRGIVLNGLRRYCLEEHGEAGLERVLAAMSPSGRQILSGLLISQTALYPAALASEFAQAMVATLGEGDPQIMRVAGAFVAMRDLSTFMRLMMKVGTPSFIASRLPKAWDTYFDAGRLELLARSSQHVVLSAHDAEPLGLVGTQAAIGWMAAAIECSGGAVRSAFQERRGRVEHFELHWS